MWDEYLCTDVSLANLLNRPVVVMQCEVFAS